MDTCLVLSYMRVSKCVQWAHFDTRITPCKTYMLPLGTCDASLHHMYPRVACDAMICLYCQGTTEPNRFPAWDLTGIPKNIQSGVENDYMQPNLAQHAILPKLIGFSWVFLLNVMRKKCFCCHEVPRSVDFVGGGFRMGGGGFRQIKPTYPQILISLRISPTLFRKDWKTLKFW